MFSILVWCVWVFEFGIWLITFHIECLNLYLRLQQRNRDGKSFIRCNIQGIHPSNRIFIYTSMKGNNSLFGDQSNNLQQSLYMKSCRQYFFSFLTTDKLCIFKHPRNCQLTSCWVFSPLNNVFTIVCICVECRWQSKIVYKTIYKHNKICNSIFR